MARGSHNGRSQVAGAILFVIVNTWCRHLYLFLGLPLPLLIHLDLLEEFLQLIAAVRISSRYLHRVFLFPHLLGDVASQWVIYLKYERYDDILDDKGDEEEEKAEVEPGPPIHTDLTRIHIHIRVPIVWDKYTEKRHYASIEIIEVHLDLETPTTVANLINLISVSRFATKE